ncbi:hypothetical protein PHLCEN_2v9307 [Hermanssonia centrifuga]|uniref:DAGKc domain-containing protein n=1 Tax=Hermanssonia centrifuga TaxID=98765 RepID=A0A2R6NR63_9APHY|nr:hypothetical protein PHLCEN_2v9307 [Hermanssonia centrifuga]
MPLLVVYNPVCGHGTARTFFQETVIPLLQEHGHHPDKIQETTHEGHAGDVVVEFLKSAAGPVSIVLGSGDGTLHEIICALHAAPSPESRRKITFALIPCGTANALYSSFFPSSASNQAPPTKLESLHSLLGLNSPSAPRPITLAITTFPSSSTAVDAKRSSISAVVTSTALHASILHDSEALRATHPGIERFKIAAQQNITRWYHATVRLLPAGDSIQVYDRSTDTFVPYPQVASEVAGPADIHGPFAYFLSTVNVDRLEPLFRIAPLQTSLPPPLPPATLDIVIVRPSRDKLVKAESTSDRELFAGKCMTVLGAAYRDGAHVKMAYDSSGEIVEDEGAESGSVVEYYRCGGWEWIPEEADDHAHLVCADGEVLRVDPKSKATCVATQNLDGYSISVYI